MCTSFTPCDFAIIHIKYHIKQSPLAPWDAAYIIILHPNLLVKQN